MSDHIEHACTRCGSLLHHEDAGSCDRRFYVSELGMVRDDLSASRRESAALGAMVARLREALEACSEWIGRDSLGDEDARTAFDSAKRALKSTARLARARALLDRAPGKGNDK